MTLNDFINTYNNKVVDTDGFYGGQCMDLMHRYIVDVLGLPLNVLAAGTAYQAFVNGDGRFNKIANTPAGVPQPGDIIFWNTTIGSAGHVAIFIDGNTSSFRSFDQNWPTGSSSHIQTHNYNGVAGWLHPKSAPQGATDMSALDLARARVLSWAVLGRNGYDGHANALNGEADGDLNSGHVGHDAGDEIWSLYNSAEGQEWITKRLPAVYDKAAQTDAWKKTAEDLQAIATDRESQIKTLQAQLATQTDDTKQLNSAGVALQWLIKRLGLK